MLPILVSVRCLVKGFKRIVILLVPFQFGYERIVIVLTGRMFNFQVVSSWAFLEILFPKLLVSIPFLYWKFYDFLS